MRSFERPGSPDRLLLPMDVGVRSQPSRDLPRDPCDLFWMLVELQANFQDQAYIPCADPIMVSPTKTVCQIRLFRAQSAAEELQERPAL